MPSSLQNTDNKLEKDFHRLAVPPLNAWRIPAAGWLLLTYKKGSNYVS